MMGPVLLVGIPNGPSVPFRVLKFADWFEQPEVKWALPIPLLIALAPFVWLFFRSTWRELEDDALDFRQQLKARGEIDYRPAVALTLSAVILTIQEYYGNHRFYDEIIRKWLSSYQGAHPGGLINLQRYEELYVLSWWALTRMGGYILPLVVWRLIFRHDSILDFGLRTKGFFEHAWIYAMFIAIMVPVMNIVASQPDFGTYYPFYKQASRSWLDLGIWEAIYVGQFFCLEVFFRGFWVRATRSLGMGALFCMAVPYCMIHYGKPYLEACGAIVAGVVLGSLSMKTKSIYAGFLVHITVAILMDLLALDHRHALPKLLTPDSIRTFEFTHVRTVFWLVWVVALAMLTFQAVRQYPTWKRWYLSRKQAL